MVGVNDFNGLGLFDGILICHYDQSRKKIYDNLQRNQEHNVYRLTDEDILVCEDDCIQKK